MLALYGLPGYPMHFVRVPNNSLIFILYSWMEKGTASFVQEQSIRLRPVGHELLTAPSQIIYKSTPGFSKAMINSPSIQCLLVSEGCLYSI